MNLDFKKFKKIESDDTTTTLVHPKGHAIKIAHKGLSSKYKKELDELPVHCATGGMPDQPCQNPSCSSHGQPHPNCKCYGGMAKGGKVKHEKDCPYADGGQVKEKPKLDDDKVAAAQESMRKAFHFAEGGTAPMPQPGPTPMAPNEEVPVVSTAPIPSQTPTPQEYPPVNAYQSAPVTDLEPKAEPDHLYKTDGKYTGAPVKEESAKQDGLPWEQAPAPTPQQRAAHISQTLLKEDAATKGDINTGHIQPHTYADVFSNKDTLGKIGTIFGLLVGGAGAGLSHQPNMLMEMMNKEIERDMEAQKTSATNKQEMMRINQNNILVRSGAARTMAEANRMSYDLDVMRKNRLALDSLIKQYEKIPEGTAQKAQWGKMLGILSQGVDAKNASIASQAGLAGALSGINLNGGDTMAAKAGFYGAPFARLAEDTEQKKYIFPDGRVAIANRPIQEQHRNKLQAMNEVEAKANDLINFAKSHEGSWNPKTRAYAQQKAEELVALYGPAIGASMTEGGRNWLDKQIAQKNPTSIIGQELYGSMERLKEIRDSNVMRRGLLLKQYNINESPKGKSSNRSQGNTIERMDPKTGKIVVYDSETLKPLRWK